MGLPQLLVVLDCAAQVVACSASDLDIDDGDGRPDVADQGQGSFVVYPYLVLDSEALEGCTAEVPKYLDIVSGYQLKHLGG